MGTTNTIRPASDTEIAGTAEFHSLHHTGLHIECTWDVCIGYLEWLAGDQRVCLVCNLPILPATQSRYGYTHVDVVDHGDRDQDAQPRLVHPMDADPFVGLSDTEMLGLDDEAVEVAEQTPIPLADVTPDQPVHITGVDVDHQGYIVEATDTTVTLVDWVRWVMGTGKPGAEGRPGEGLVLNLAEITAIRIEAEDGDIPVTVPNTEPEVQDSHIVATVRLTASNIEHGELPIPATIRERKRGRTVHQGRVTYRTKARRRARNRLACRSRRINRVRA